MQAAEAAEWEARQAVVAAHAEEARRLKLQRRAATEAQRRAQVRFECLQRKNFSLDAYWHVLTRPPLHKLRQFKPKHRGASSPGAVGASVLRRNPVF